MNHLAGKKPRCNRPHVALTTGVKPHHRPKAAAPSSCYVSLPFTWRTIFPFTFWWPLLSRGSTLHSGPSTWLRKSPPLGSQSVSFFLFGPRLAHGPVYQDPLSTVLVQRFRTGLQLWLGLGRGLWCVPVARCDYSRQESSHSGRFGHLFLPANGDQCWDCAHLSCGWGRSDCCVSRHSGKHRGHIPIADSHLAVPAGCSCGGGPRARISVLDITGTTAFDSRTDPSKALQRSLRILRHAQAEVQEVFGMLSSLHCLVSTGVVS